MGKKVEQKIKRKVKNREGGTKRREKGQMEWTPEPTAELSG